MHSFPCVVLTSAFPLSFPQRNAAAGHPIQAAALVPAPAPHGNARATQTLGYGGDDGGMSGGGGGDDGDDGDDGDHDDGWNPEMKAKSEHDGSRNPLGYWRLGNCGNTKDPEGV